jgi:hypothetical protein
MYKIKINNHGVILTQYGSAENTPVHGSTDSAGFTWLEAKYPIDGQSQYWDGSAWVDCGTKPHAWSVWENANWVESSGLKENLELSALKQLKAYRSRLLTATDWTQGADSPLSDEKKAEWATYRQVLRDFPATSSATTDISTLTWPTVPS